MYKKECEDCIHLNKEFYCPIMNIEIIVGRINIADECGHYTQKKKEGD